MFILIILVIILGLLHPRRGYNIAQTLFGMIYLPYRIGFAVLSRNA